MRQQIAWSYANLAMADAAFDDSAERLKMTMPQACYYCGSAANLAVDHLIPRIKGGPDEADNLVWSCRGCNSSKGGRDMPEWMGTKGRFPSVLLLRRYIKIVARCCKRQGCVDAQQSGAPALALPFDALLLPTRFLPLNELQRWVYPPRERRRCEQANAFSALPRWTRFAAPRVVGSGGPGSSHDGMAGTTKVRGTYGHF